MAANDHGIGFMAAGVAFWSALALFPAVALLIWLAHHLLGVADVRDALRTVTHVMPDSIGDIVARAIQAASDANPADRGADLLWPVGPAFGLLVSLWSVTVAMQALVHALDRTFETEERRSWLRLTAVSLAFSVGALVVMACSLAATVAMTHALAPVDGALPGALARWGTAFFAFLLTVATLYRVAPSGGREGLPFVTVGGLAAAAALVAECGLFSWVVGHFATLDVTYGSLSTVAAFLLWLWVSVAIVLAGAELDMALDHETRLRRAGGIRRRGAAERLPSTDATP
ncbi:YihY/virulence factor BrkB family protein [Methylobacterium radiotolerans]|uniref:YihY/virulence factor BrkB family protein n=1 Tax=Methylobacterium radiotolerans TaxID=31998 RepID=UPI001F30F6DD|nr:YihY/virulence factor BrkB family protein [Methylobacterium radiotolerans]UIY44264.1 YihY/virulence factor BrkB family protein [Methylobacterium radiotolerans]